MRTMSRSAVLSGLLAAALLLPVGVEAQNTLGVGVSLVSASFTGEGTDVLDARTSVGFGAWLAIPINERFNFVPGLAFAPKGYSFSDSSEDVTLKLSYIEIPLLVSVPFAGGEGSTAFHAFGGPSVSFEAGCTIDFEEVGASGSEDCGSDDDRSKLDLGLMAGLGATVPAFERYALTINVGIDLGLTDLDEDPGDAIKNRAFFASVGLAIPLGQN